MKTVLGCLLLALSSWAQAGWILVDSENNPTDHSDLGSQSPAVIEAWLEDLLGGTTDLNLVGESDDTPAELTGLEAGYIVLHYGNDEEIDGDKSNSVYAYTCSVDCGTFTPESMKGLSNYRLFTTTVPEPGTLGLLGLGLAGLVLIRRRHR